MNQVLLLIINASHEMYVYTLLYAPTTVTVCARINAAAATPAAAAAPSPPSPPEDVVFRYKSNPCTTYFKFIITLWYSHGYEAKFFIALITHTVSRIWLGN